MIFHTGNTYRGRMIVDSTVFEVLPKHVIPALEEVGFTDVEVWFSADELPDDWPDDKRSDVSDYFGETQVWLQGTWNGEDGVEAPSSGDKWSAYDIWEYKKSSEADVYERGMSTMTKALIIGGTALGVFFAGLPIVLGSLRKD